MKQFTVCLLLFLLINIQSHAQVDTARWKTDRRLQVDQLLAQAKKQRTTGWVLLASGLALEGIATALFPKDYDFIFGSTPEKQTTATFSTILFFAGAAAWISSIPTLIRSRVTK